MRILFLWLALALFITPAAAAQRSYLLQAEQSHVNFEWDFGADVITGTMPVARADLKLDFARAANSKVDVLIDVSGAKAGFPFASQAMMGPKVLDAKRFPQIRFLSTRVSPMGAGAEIEGNITIRGVTRSTTLKAEIFRQTGTVENDLTKLTIILTGAVNRSEFGAGGWADFAGDEIRLRIRAQITQEK